MCCCGRSHTRDRVGVAPFYQHRGGGLDVGQGGLALPEFASRQNPGGRKGLISDHGSSLHPSTPFHTTKLPPPSNPTSIHHIWQRICVRRSLRLRANTCTPRSAQAWACLGVGSRRRGSQNRLLSLPVAAYVQRGGGDRCQPVCVREKVWFAEEWGERIGLGGAGVAVRAGGASPRV